MILQNNTIKYFNLIHSKVIKAMGDYSSNTPYFIEDDPFINNYECIRKVWYNSIPITKACSIHNLSRSNYYEIEDRFIVHGLPGLFTIQGVIKERPELEQLILMIRNCRPSISQIAIFRIAQAVPVTQKAASADIISKILNSHGYGYMCLDTDREFWGRIQRSLMKLDMLMKNPVKGRKKDQRKNTFFIDSDYYHKRLECLRQLFFNRKLKIKETCIRFNIPLTNYYRLLEEYRLYGPLSIISGNAQGKKESISNELQLKIILDKLEHPAWSSQEIVNSNKLSCSRFVVNRVIKRWGLEDKKRPAIALDRYVKGSLAESGEIFKPVKTAYELLSEKEILKTKRINRHFQLICKKMKTHAYNICDPGPFILAPFINDLGIVQSFETYGPPKLRGREITNLALLNVFRILAGYRRISHLSDNRDRSVALASGIGLFGSSSKFYDDSIKFKFDQLHKMKCDLVTRAKELGIIEGMRIGFDFHFKEFYGKNSSEKGIGKGPDKGGKLVPGFRPHVAWDLASNVIMSIAYYQGSVRSPKIIRQFCEQNIFPIFDPLAIQEIYMDSEYTKEGDFHYFKETMCKNGEIYVCLKQNPQIKNFIQPALQENIGWLNADENDDEYNTINVILPKTKLPLTIVILRDREKKDNIRCFGTTNMSIESKELLSKYRYRWLVENGLKDLVYSYFIDEINGSDPEKIEFEFYCVMVARLAYEYFLKELGGKYLNKEDGNKYTLKTMRNLLFEKRNCTVQQDINDNIVLTILDTGMNNLIQCTIDMLQALKDKGKNKVLWWDNRGIILRIKNQYDIKVSEK